MLPRGHAPEPRPSPIRLSFLLAGLFCCLAPTSPPPVSGAHAFFLSAEVRGLRALVPSPPFSLLHLWRQVASSPLLGPMCVQHSVWTQVFVCSYLPEAATCPAGWHPPCSQGAGVLLSPTVWCQQSCLDPSVPVPAADPLLSLLQSISTSACWVWVWTVPRRPKRGRRWALLVALLGGGGGFRKQAAVGGPFSAPLPQAPGCHEERGPPDVPSCCGVSALAKT